MNTSIDRGVNEVDRIQLIRLNQIIYSHAISQTFSLKPIRYGIIQAWI